MKAAYQPHIDFLRRERRRKGWVRYECGGKYFVLESEFLGKECSSYPDTWAISAFA